MGNAAPVRTATDFEIATLYRIRALLEDNSSKSTKALLNRLWGAVMPSDYTYKLPSPHWYLVGFQVTDPRIAYKRGGCLALEQLVFFAERFPSTFIHFVNQDMRLHPDQRILLARTGIQVTFELCKLFDDGSAALPYWRLVRTEEMFHELFVFVILLLKQLSTHESNNQGFDLNIAQETVRAALTKYLGMGPSTVAQLYFWSGVTVPTSGPTYLRIFSPSQVPVRSAAGGGGYDLGYTPTYGMDRAVSAPEYAQYGNITAMNSERGHSDPSMQHRRPSFVAYQNTSADQDVDSKLPPGPLPMPSGVVHKQHQQNGVEYEGKYEESESSETSSSNFKSKKSKKKGQESAKWEQFLKRVGREELEKQGILEKQAEEHNPNGFDSIDEFGNPLDEASKFKLFLRRKGIEELEKQGVLKTTHTHPAKDFTIEAYDDGEDPAYDQEAIQTSIASSKKYPPKPPPGPPPLEVLAPPLLSPLQTENNTMFHIPTTAIPPAASKELADISEGWLWRWWPKSWARFCESSNGINCSETGESVVRCCPYLPAPEQAAWFTIDHETPDSNKHDFRNSYASTLTWSSAPGHQPEHVGCVLRLAVVEDIVAFDILQDGSNRGDDQASAPGSFIKVSLRTQGAWFVLRAPSPMLRERWVKSLKSVIAELGALPPPPPPPPPPPRTTNIGGPPLLNKSNPTIVPHPPAGPPLPFASSIPADREPAIHDELQSHDGPILRNAVSFSPLQFGAKQAPITSETESCIHKGGDNSICRDAAIKLSEDIESLSLETNKKRLLMINGGRSMDDLSILRSPPRSLRVFQSHADDGSGGTLAAERLTSSSCSVRNQRHSSNPFPLASLSPTRRTFGQSRLNAGKIFSSDAITELPSLLSSNKTNMPEKYQQARRFRSPASSPSSPSASPPTPMSPKIVSYSELTVDTVCSGTTPITSPSTSIAFSSGNNSHSPSAMTCTVKLSPTSRFTKSPSLRTVERSPVRSPRRSPKTSDDASSHLSTKSTEDSPNMDENQTMSLSLASLQEVNTNQTGAGDNSLFSPLVLEDNDHDDVRDCHNRSVEGYASNIVSKEPFSPITSNFRDPDTRMSKMFQKKKARQNPDASKQDPEICERIYVDTSNEYEDIDVGDVSNFFKVSQSSPSEGGNDEVGSDPSSPSSVNPSSIIQDQTVRTEAVEFPWREYRSEDGYPWIYNESNGDTKWGSLAEHFPTNFGDKEHNDLGVDGEVSTVSNGTCQYEDVTFTNNEDVLNTHVDEDTQPSNIAYSNANSDDSSFPDVEHDLNFVANDKALEDRRNERERRRMKIRKRREHKGLSSPTRPHLDHLQDHHRSYEQASHRPQYQSPRQQLPPPSYGQTTRHHVHGSYHQDVKHSHQLPSYVPRREVNPHPQQSCVEHSPRRQPYLANSPAIRHGPPQQQVYPQHRQHPFFPQYQHSSPPTQLYDKSPFFQPSMHSNERHLQLHQPHFNSLPLPPGALNADYVDSTMSEYLQQFDHFSSM